MGREIRRVPPHWEHPKDSEGDYIPLFYDFIGSIEMWLKYYKEFLSVPKDLHDYLEDGLPDPLNYAHYPKETATWWQMYENTSEGTPVTPAFETEHELVLHLVTKGTFYDSTPWDLDTAKGFVASGYAPDLIAVKGK